MDYISDIYALMIKKDLRSFGPKTTELEQFPSVPADFSDIRDFSKIAVFRILAVILKFRSRAQF